MKKNKLTALVLLLLLSACEAKDDEVSAHLRNLPTALPVSSVEDDSGNSVTVEVHKSKYSNVPYYTLFRVNTDDVLVLLRSNPGFKSRDEDSVFDGVIKGKFYKFAGTGKIRYLTKNGKLFHVSNVRNIDDNELTETVNINTQH